MWNLFSVSLNKTSDFHSPELEAQRARAAIKDHHLRKGRPSTLPASIRSAVRRPPLQDNENLIVVEEDARSSHSARARWWARRTKKDNLSALPLPRMPKLPDSVFDPFDTFRPAPISIEAQETLLYSIRYQGRAFRKSDTNDALFAMQRDVVGVTMSHYGAWYCALLIGLLHKSYCTGLAFTKKDKLAVLWLKNEVLKELLEELRSDPSCISDGMLCGQSRESVMLSTTKLTNSSESNLPLMDDSPRHTQ